MEPHKRLIVALDTSSESQALEWVRLLGPRCGAVKVGMQLYASGGPQIVRTIRDAGAEIFLDLKLQPVEHRGERLHHARHRRVPLRQIPADLRANGL